MSPNHICALYENLLETYENILNLSTLINDNPAETVEALIEIRMLSSDLSRLVRYLLSQSYLNRIKAFEILKEKYLNGEGGYFGYDKDVEIIFEAMHKF